MCYHTKQSKIPKVVQRRFNAKIDDISNFVQSENINGFDFPFLPVIEDENPHIITNYNWGLIPSWANDDKIRAVTLNAKVETLEEKASFKEVINNRCLVIANAFYEWRWLDAKGKNKIKYEIGHENEDLFAFAGIYSKWFNSNTGNIVNTFSIVTTEANPLMAEIHNIKKRMPIILKKEDEQRWLQHENQNEFAFPYTTNLVAKQISGRNDNQLALF